MAEECASCGGYFASPSELLAHTKKAHPTHDSSESLAMNPESLEPGLVCALCGVRFRDSEALARHNVSPHPPTNRSGRKTPVGA
ncbi:MAG: C2H2-type zinc finger protein [Thermoplasmata archaeon]